MNAAVLLTIQTAPPIADGSALFDSLGALVIVDAEQYTTCDQQRADCAAALLRLERARVIQFRVITISAGR